MSLCVVAAEQQFTATKNGADVGLCATAIATIGGGEAKLDSAIGGRVTFAGELRHLGTFLWA